MDKLATEEDNPLEPIPRLSRHDLVAPLHWALTVSAALEHKVCRQQDHSSTVRHVGMLPVAGIIDARESI